MKAVPPAVVADDGTRVVFWRLRRGAKHAKNSQGIGATLYYPDGDRVNAWGTSLRQKLNGLPGVPGLNQICEAAQRRLSSMDGNDD